MGAFGRLRVSVLGGARRGLDRVLPDRSAAGPEDAPTPTGAGETPSGKAPGGRPDPDDTPLYGTTGGPAATGPPTAVEPATATGGRVESTKLLIDKAMGGERHDRQLTGALLAVMVALLIIVPAGAMGLLLVGLGGFPEGWEGAERIEVTTAADGRPGSLRAAVEQAAASGADTVIQLEPNTTYRLTTGCNKPGGDDRPLDQPQDGVLNLGSAGLYLKGNGATIQQQCADQRVMRATGDDRLHLSNVTLSGGQATAALGNGSGGALLSEGGGTVTIEDSMLTSNRAEDSGGAVAMTGPGSVLNLTRSVISGNRAGSAGGGVWVIGRLNAINSTITDNLAGTNAGAVATTIDLTFSTVVDNSTATARDARQLGAGELTSFASYVAGGSGATRSCSVERTTSEGYNVGDDASCGFGPGLGDVANGPNNAVGLLDYYERSLPARAPVPGSVLVDRVPTQACLPRTRPSYDDGQGRNRKTLAADAGCDVGAVELPVGLDVPLTATAGPVATPVPAEARYTG